MHQLGKEKLSPQMHPQTIPPAHASLAYGEHGSEGVRTMDSQQKGSAVLHSASQGLLRVRDQTPPSDVIAFHLRSAGRGRKTTTTTTTPPDDELPRLISQLCCAEMHWSRQKCPEKHIRLGIHRHTYTRPCRHASIHTYVHTYIPTYIHDK